MSPATLDCVYADEMVTATDLNRQSGLILDKASKHPVTITRDGVAFALLRRDQMLQLTTKAKFNQDFVETLVAITVLLTGQKLGFENPYGWLSVFDREELHDFIQEVMEAYRLTDCTKELPNTVNAIIHEWHESAIAIASPELAAAFSDDDESAELPLTEPTTCTV